MDNTVYITLKLVQPVLPMVGTEKVEPASFLTLLDSDPEQARILFSQYAMWFFAQNFITIVSRLSLQDREELRQETILHCLKDDFRILRKYIERGKGFGNWFHNKCVDMINQGLIGSPRTSPIIDPAPDPSPPDDSVNRTALHLVRKLIAEMSDKCQALLALAAREFKPNEIARVMRINNKKVADDLRYCRSRLNKMLKEHGATEPIG